MHWRRKCNQLQYSCLENPRDKEAWWAAIYGVAQSQTQLKQLSSSSNCLKTKLMSTMANIHTIKTSTVQFSHSVMSDSLWPHGLQHARLSCPSPTPGACSNSCPLSRWCHPTISSSAVSFSSCPQSLSASGSFQMSQLFTSASASVLPMNIQDWFPLGWTGWISLQSKGLSRVFSNTTVRKHQFFGAQLSLWSNSRILTWLLEKP